MISKYINMAAAEIEGIWYNMEGFRGPKVINEIGSPIHDGSVAFPKSHKKRILDIYEGLKTKGKVIHSIQQLMLKGEVVSSPLKSLADLSQWIVKYWPDLTNNSCGLHYHVSFNTNGYYSALMTDHFNEYFKKSLAEFASQEKLNKIFHDRFYNRTEWARKYCKDTFHPEKQAYVTKKVYHDSCPDRYTILNYCFGLHSTLEIRVFSAHMSPKMAVKCLHWWIGCVNQYLIDNYDNFAKTEIGVEEVNIELGEEEPVIKTEEISEELKEFLTFLPEEKELEHEFNFIKSAYNNLDKKLGSF